MAWDKIRRETIILESWGTKSTNGTIVLASDKVNLYKKWLLGTLSLNALDSIDATEPVDEIYNALNSKFGFGRLDTLAHKEAIRALKIGTDLDAYLTKFKLMRDQLVAANSPMSADDAFDCLLMTMRNHSVTFWMPVLKDVKDMRATLTISAVQELMLDHWAFFKQDLPKYKPEQPKQSSNNVGRGMRSKPREYKLRDTDKVCEHCMNSGNPFRARACMGHTTAECRTGPAKKESADKASEEPIKAAQEYKSPLFHDSGATSHFFKDAPPIAYKHTKQLIHTAGSDDAPHVAV